MHTPNYPEKEVVDSTITQPSTSAPPGTLLLRELLVAPAQTTPHWEGSVYTGDALGPGASRETVAHVYGWNDKGCD